VDPNPFRRRSFRWPWRSASDVRAEVDAELRFHLDMRVEELVRQGLPPESARRQAVAQFGDLAGTRKFCVDQDTRTEDRLRRRLMLDELRQDIRIGSRRLWKAELASAPRPARRRSHSVVSPPALPALPAPCTLHLGFCSHPAPCTLHPAPSYS
jgi:hypothetical protein